MEFPIDAYQTNEAANVFLKVPGFAQNPIGVEFDPDDLLARLRAGESDSSFLKRTVYMPAVPWRNPAIA